MERLLLKKAAMVPIWPLTGNEHGREAYKFYWCCGLFLGEKKWLSKIRITETLNIETTVCIDSILQIC